MMRRKTVVLAVTLVLCAVRLQTAHAAVGGSATFFFLGSPVVIYENRDTTSPVTIDLSIEHANAFGALTVSWTDAAGIPQTLTVPSSPTGVPRSAGVRTTPTRCQASSSAMVPSCAVFDDGRSIAWRRAPPQESSGRVLERGPP